MGVTFLDIIILAGLALFLIKKLKDILGTRPPEDENSSTNKESSGKIIDIEISKDVYEQEETQSQDKTTTKEVFDVNDPVDSVLGQISYSIVGFSKVFFLNGAKMAFEMILKAYAEGDTKTLKKLLSSGVFERFEEAIKTRKSSEQNMESQFIGFKQAEIIAATLSKKEATITVKFISEQVNLIKDKDGKVLEGDANFIETVTDVWTFSKELKSSDPTWILSSTKNA